jgi:hypothetical protein
VRLRHLKIDLCSAQWRQWLLPDNHHSSFSASVARKLERFAASTTHRGCLLEVIFDPKHFFSKARGGNATLVEQLTVMLPRFGFQCRRLKLTGFTAERAEGHRFEPE